ncbi:DUF3631 domain-containing protein [Ralstonia mannitolilytica]
MSPRQLSKKLDEYGIKSKNIRIGLHTPKGFELDQFRDAFSRYLTPGISATPPQKSANPYPARDSGCGGQKERSATATSQAPHATNSRSSGADEESVACGGFSEGVADAENYPPHPQSLTQQGIDGNCGGVADKSVGSEKREVSATGDEAEADL